MTHNSGQPALICMSRLFALAILWAHSALVMASDCNARTPEAFPDFFSRFAADKGFSVKRAIFPLQAVKWEFGVDANGKDEPAPVRFRISKAQFESAPSLSNHMRENGLTSRTKSVGSKSAAVDVFKEDTDWLTTHHFVRRGNCWFLYKYEDSSL
ncbi:MAG: hypothetical protein PHX38_03320 [Sulfuricella sp.]|nr:hypothetical protein [Sulfuricella sp.]